MSSQIRQDLRFAVRSMRRSRLVTFVAAASLAFGIGMVTSIFSVLNATVFRAVPYADPRHIVVITPAGGGRALLSLDQAAAIRDGVPAFQRSGAFVRGQIALTIDGKAQDVPATEVDSGVFTLLGVRAMIGRLPAASELGARRSGGRHQRGLVRARVRGRPEHCRAEPTVRRCYIHDRWRDATGL